MELLCPECLAPLTITEGDRARCAVHGGPYRVLFRRKSAPAATNDPFPFESVTSTNPAFPVPPPLPVIPPLPETAPRLAAMQCAQHPSVAATARCDVCGALMCTTCALKLEGNTHVCPVCAVSLSAPPSSKRAPALWSLALAGWCTAALVALIVAVSLKKLDLDEDGNLIRGLCSFGIIFPAIAGLLLGVQGIKRGEKSTALAWIAALWSGGILLLLPLMLVFGFSK